MLEREKNFPFSIAFLQIEYEKNILHTGLLKLFSATYSRRTFFFVLFYCVFVILLCCALRCVLYSIVMMSTFLIVIPTYLIPSGSIQIIELSEIINFLVAVSERSFHVLASFKCPNECTYLNRPKS